MYAIRSYYAPAVVGTKQATSLLKEGQIVTIDGEKGIIYDGKLEISEEANTAAKGPAIVASLV